MDHVIFTLVGFVLILLLLGIAAAQFGVDSRSLLDDRNNHRTLP